MTRRYVWIVEHWWEHRERWMPTVGVALDRNAARSELANWRARNPHDRFRLTKYEARGGGQG